MCGLFENVKGTFQEDLLIILLPLLRDYVITASFQQKASLGDDSLGGTPGMALEPQLINKKTDSA